MNHIFYQTKTYFTNTGDVLINNALISVLRNYGQIHANCSSDVPPEFIKALGIKEDERMISGSELSFVKAVIKCASDAKKSGDKVYLFSGLGDMYGGSARLALRNFLSGLIFPIFRHYGVTIVRIGRSVGPITKLMALTERIRSKSLSFNYVRDSKSLNRCQDMKIKNAQQCPDMSWLYDIEHDKKINHTNAVMVNLRNSIFDDVENDFIDSTLSKCRQVLQTLKQSIPDMKIVVAYQIAEDEPFSKTVYDYLTKEFENVERIDHQLSLSEFEGAYGGVDYHVSNRMHSLLAGYKYGSLPIALIDTEKHTKISATFGDCALDEFLVNISDDSISKRVEYIAQNREDMIEKIWKCEKECFDFIIKTLDNILK